MIDNFSGLDSGVKRTLNRPGFSLCCSSAIWSVMLALFSALRVVVLALVAAFAATLSTSAAVNRTAVEKSFRQWLAAEIWPEAQAAGISRKTFDAALGKVTLDWDLPELRPPGSDAPHVVEHQAEFRSPAAYFDNGRMSRDASSGRAQVAKWAKTLAAIEQRYGVPGEILVAIWGRETGFGNAALPHAAVRTIATHAFMSRRKEFFRPELVAILQVVQAGEVAPSAMKSSWAGALGQPQFLPSYYLKYAVDFDGDGRRDIWKSVPDTLASMANFLRGEGWNPERGWGVEASVPPSVDCHLEGPEQGKGMGDWAALGVVQVDGRPLPGANLNRESFLLMPAGRLGPAFIVSNNFYVLKEYNFSDLYALYVGHLADRFSDNRPFAGKWGKVGGFTRADVARMQRAFESQGHDVGGSDGLIGFKTRVAVGRRQAESGRPVTCYPDAAMVKGGS
jgi:lytic murein transglycosylase